MARSFGGAGRPGIQLVMLYQWNDRYIKWEGKKIDSKTRWFNTCARIRAPSCVKIQVRFLRRTFWPRICWQLTCLPILEMEGSLFQAETVNNRMEEWIGPFIVSAIDMIRKLDFVQIKSTEPAKAFRFAKINKYSQPQQALNIYYCDSRATISCFISESNKENAD